MTPNIPLLRKGVEWVEAEEQRTTDREWYQGYWLTKGVEATAVAKAIGLGDLHFCETASCLAGWVAITEGWAPSWVDDAETTQWVEKNGRVDSVVSVADKALGLTAPQVADLFVALNTAADIRRIAEDIAGERL